MARTQIVIPCFNEAARLDRGRVRSFVREHPDIGLLFVNDGSLDETADILDDLHLHAPWQIEVLHLPRNLGKAEAVRRGMVAVLEAGATAAGYWDADFSTPIEDVSLFQNVLDRRDNVSLVIGTRLSLLGRSIRRRWTRRQAGRLFARCASLVVGLPIVDTQCGAKLFRVDDSTRALFDRPFLSRWIFDVELLVRWKLACRRLGWEDCETRLYELPIDTWREVPGSKLKGRDFARAVGELAHIWWTYSSRPAPLPPEECRDEHHNPFRRGEADCHWANAAEEDKSERAEQNQTRMNDEARR
jgi:dolichyl-phosphate beta-glucosyltransferase